MRKYWIPFQTNVYDEIMTAGFVVVRLHRIETGDMVPVALSSQQLGKTHYVTTTVDPNTTQTRFRVYRLVNKRTGKRLDKPTLDKKAHVLGGFGWDPTPEGQIRSLVTNLMDVEIFHTRLQQLRFIGEHNITLPPLVTETDKDSARIESSEIDHYADMDRHRARNEGAFRRRTHDPQSTAFAQRLKQVKEPWLPQSSGIEARAPFQDNYFDLPHGHRVARQQLPSRNAQYINEEKNYQEQVSAVYGIPRGILVQDAAGYKTDVKELTHVIRRTMTMWTNIISKILTNVYRCIYHPEDCNFMLGIIPKNKKPMSEEELFAIAEKIAAVQVIIAMPPMADLQQMMTLYLMGSATWAELHDAMRTSAGLSPSRPPPEPSKQKLVQGDGEMTKPSLEAIALQATLQAKSS